jgi:general secretion pathway protein G
MRDRARGLPADGGFTLIELMVVVSIIGLISTIVAVNVLAQREKASVSKARADMAAFSNGIKLFYMDHNAYPSSLEDLLVPPGYLEDGREVLLDPWRREYHYAQPGADGRPYSIWSYGAEGTPGGEDTNADIYAK